MPRIWVLGRDVRLVEAIAASHAQEVSLNMRDAFRDAYPFLGINASLKITIIHIHKSYRLITAVTEQVNQLFRNISRTYPSIKRYCDRCLTS